MKLIFNFLSIFFISVFIGCTACSDSSDNTHSKNSENKISCFITASDLHYYAAELGVDNEAFRNNKYNDTKLTRESSYIIRALIDNLKSEPEKTVIITGDLTGNGELYNHQCVAKLLEELRAAGKKVFVLPGNHDINNPFSARFSGGFEEKIPTVSPAEFRSIYADFGFNSAISSDQNSLSYAAYPDSVTMLVALDVNRYDENTSSVEISGGHLRSGTKAWLDSLLSSAAPDGRNVIIATHQGVVEHFTGQAISASDYLIDNASELIEILLKHKIRLALSGHFHANDIAKYSAGELYDIETGSAITWTNSYRKIGFSPSEINVTTKNISGVNYNTGGISFYDYSKARTLEGLNYYAQTVIPGKFPDIDEETKSRIETEFAEAVLAHLAGDEKPSETSRAFIDALTSSRNMNKIVAAVMLRGLYTDTAPADRNVKIEIDREE